MTWLRGRWVPLTVLVAALAALIASLVWVSGPSGGPSRHGPMTGIASRDGPVRSLTDAGRAADRFGDRWGLHVGEVMRFTNGYYAELLDASGKGATEVLIDPRSGTVHLEFGPAMMWNTAYGMMSARADSRAATIGPEQASGIANRWLEEHRPGLRAAEPEDFPGYYTLHTQRNGKTVGMLSVNDRTGDVWYHTWHGRFVEMREPADSQ
ncbi:hypothetical protein [Streptomyces sp. HUAS TT20]|uniref:hypothetical protein n=1 Tax=Streptomyces sp. HUAS TT20 TaxID=3447509 RepID=UPI0021D82A77|nr:hypothetical protein [Streptomyces sp. HUAS 15-9]UXY32315.1 hypothetical protein N8I87_41325 [Streptomyces sp. HUAS 15-9]